MGCQPQVQGLLRETCAEQVCPPNTLHVPARPWSPGTLHPFGALAHTRFGVCRAKPNLGQCLRHPRRYFPRHSGAVHRSIQTGPAWGPGGHRRCRPRRRYQGSALRDQLRNACKHTAVCGPAVTLSMGGSHLGGSGSQLGEGGGGGVNRAPQIWGGVREKGSIDRTIIMNSGAEGAENSFGIENGQNCFFRQIHGK